MMYSFCPNIGNPFTTYGIANDFQHQTFKPASPMRAATNAGVSQPSAPEHESLKFRFLSAVNSSSVVRLLSAIRARFRHEPATGTEFLTDRLKNVRSDSIELDVINSAKPAIGAEFPADTLQVVRSDSD